MVKGMELYRTSAVIDLINLLSVACGHSIGGFDADRIDGDTVTLGIGREGEPYEAIGRGPLNIAGMPVWRDNTGGIGTPTSDNDRTKLSPGTRHLLMIVNMYGSEMPVPDIEFLATRLLTTYANATNIKIKNV
ncbi:MAG: phenylalanine--tRNA ligase beta subunit-related protein [Muribaculaceae bacterium]